MAGFSAAIVELRPVMFSRYPAFDGQRIFQVLVVLYVVVTGEVPKALQAALFGIVGGGETAFLLAFISAIAVDAARLAPLFALRRSPLGVLHPLIIAVLVWPLMVNLPNIVQQLGGLSGLFLSEPVRPPIYRGLIWQTYEQIWLATAKYNLLQFLGLCSLYLGFALSQGRSASQNLPYELNTIALRRLLVIVVGLTLLTLVAFISLREGLDSHLADLSRGRFRSLAGLGPVIAIFDLGIIAMIIWVAARPQDVKTPIFLACVMAVAATQFLSNGSRSAALTLFMILAVTWALRTRRIPWRLALIMIPVIFFALGLLAIVRSSGLTNQSATEVVSGAEGAQVLLQIKDEIERRQFLAGTVPVVAEGFRVTDGPLLGRSYLAAIFAFVPRSLWEEKPRGPGSLYTQFFFGEAREGTSVPIGPVAEAYWNFGIIGVLLLFFLYGLLLKKVHDLYRTRTSNPFIICLFVIFVTRFHVFTDSLVQFQQQMLLLGFVYLLTKLTVRPVHLSSQAPSGVSMAA